MAATGRLKNESQCKSRMNCDLDPAITLSQRRDVAVLNSSWREKKFMDEGLVTLWCAVYGEATVFSVTIARDAKVENLQKAIFEDQRYRERFSFPPNDLTLYLAKKDGAWLEHDDDVEEFLRGEVDKTYRKMLSSRRLNKVDYFGKDFEPGEEEIHILVQLPKAAAAPVLPASSTNTRVDMNENSDQLTAPYTEAARRLKDDPAVSQLVAAVRYVAADLSRPFIVLESSSGMGKTQMAFNLMARDEIETHYVVCESGDVNELRQDVYSAFKARSATFLECIQSDLGRNIGKGEIHEDPKRMRLQTFEFVRALLCGADKMTHDRCTYEDVRDLLKTRTKQPVVFLDEFPLLDREKQNELKLRFMRTVFRTLGLPVILSSTNGTARNMLVTGNGSSRGKIDVLWCVVVPEMAGFQDPTLEILPRKDIARLVEHSRPLFARSALEYVQEHELPKCSADDEQVIDYMNELTRELAVSCQKWKASSSRLSSSDWFCVGQLCLFLSANFYESTSVSTHLIQGHFARLQDQKMFELRFAAPKQFDKWELEQTSGASLVGKKPRGRNPWHVRTVFPPIEQDVLLYLSLLGGKDHHAFTDSDGERVPFCAALHEVGTRVPNAFDFRNPHQASNDGMRLEAMTVAAIVSASHCNGFAGIPLDAFLREMVYELGMGHPETVEVMCELIPPALRSRMVPFLAPPDTQWPAWLPSALKLGAIVRTVNADPLDLQIDDGWFTGECKDYGASLNLVVMKKILERIPPSSEIHVVVTNKLQKRYFTVGPFEDYLETLKTRDDNPLDMTDTRVLQCGSDGVVREISGMETKAAATLTDQVGVVVTPANGESEPWPRRLVLFVARGIDDTAIAAVEMQTGTNEQDPSRQVKKRRTSGDGYYSVEE